MRNIDIIIPVHNRAQILSEILPTYYNQPEAHAIFIIDDASVDDVKSVVDAAAAHAPIPIHYHRFPKSMRQQACKNFGVSKSNQPYIFIGEDDLWLAPDHFAVLINAIEGTGADIVGGRRVYIHDGESQAHALEASRADARPIFKKLPFEAYFERYTEQAVEVPYMHSNVLMRRDVFSSAQYDVGYKGNSFREELDFYLQCSAAGKQMWLIPKTACFHLKSPRKMGSGSQIARLRYEWYVWRNTIQCFKKNKVVLKQRFGILFPVGYAVLSLLARYPYGLWNEIKRF